MNLSIVFAKMAMLVLIMLLGYLCARIGITGPEFNQRVTPLMVKVLLPATILNSVLSVPDFTGRDIVDYVLVLTVKMITDAVGCSRKTFYYYFTDIYVLTQYVFELRVQHFLDTNGNFETVREGFLTLAANLSNDRQAILNIYHGYGKEELERFTWETSDYYARQVITRYAQNMDIMPEDLEAIIRMYTDMMFGMLIDWINNGMEGDYSRKLDIALTALMPVLRANCRSAKAAAADQ